LPRSNLCAVTLWPVGVPRSGYATPERSYPLAPHVKGRQPENFRFHVGQRLVALVTNAEDARAGWVIDAGSTRLSTDPIGPNAYGDLGFSVFHTVAGLMLFDAYRDREVIEEVELTASATLYGEAAQMVHGVTVLYEDDRFSCGAGRYAFAPPRMMPRMMPPPMMYETRTGVTLDVVPFQSIVVNYLPAESKPDPDGAQMEEAVRKVLDE